MSDFKPGDLIGFSGDSYLSAFINIVTFGIPGWSLSHIGIVGEYKDELVLFESTTLDDIPCIIQGRKVAGAQAQRIGPRLERYRGRAWHYSIFRPLFDHERKRLNEFLMSTLGTPYDMIGAFRAGGYGFSWIESRMREADLHSLFCSEWCAAAHAEIGLFATDNVARWSPNLLARTERRAGILRKPRRLR